MATHRYWQFRIGATNGEQFVHIAEAEMRATSGGANQCSGGTASASSNNVAGQAADYAFDGTASTGWVSAAGSYGNAFLRYDFGAGSPKTVLEVAVTCGTSAGWTAHVVNEFYVEGSDDGATWFLYAVVTRQAAWSLGETRIFSVSATVLDPGTSADADARRYWRFICDANNDGTHLIVGDISWRDGGGTRIIPIGTPSSPGVVASTTNSSSPPGRQEASKVNDGLIHATGFWASANGAAVNAALRFDFGRNVLPADIQITSRGDTSSPSNDVKDFRLESSPDGTAWTTNSTVTNQTGWTIGETRTFPLAASPPAAGAQEDAAAIDSEWAFLA